MKIIRKMPGQAPEILTGKMATVGLKMIESMPSVHILPNGLALYFNEDHPEGAPADFICNGWPIWGTAYVASRDAAGKPAGVQDVDKTLRDVLCATRYRPVDKKHNVWQCRSCRHLARFEADGPFENGWNVCPSCRLSILPPPEE